MKPKKPKKKASNPSKTNAGCCVRFITAKNRQTGEDMFLVVRAELSSIIAREMLDTFSQGVPTEFCLKTREYIFNAKNVMDFEVESKRFMRNLCSKITDKMLLTNCIGFEMRTCHSPKKNSKKK